MTKDNPSIPERITAVEVELKYVKEGLHDLKDDFTKCSMKTHSQLTDLTLVVETKLRGSLSGREKVTLLVSIITSVAAIIIAFLK